MSNRCWAVKELVGFRSVTLALIVANVSISVAFAADYPDQHYIDSFWSKLNSGGHIGRLVENCPGPMTVLAVSGVVTVIPGVAAVNVMGAAGYANYSIGADGIFPPAFADAESLKVRAAGEVISGLGNAVIDTIAFPILAGSGMGGGPTSDYVIGGMFKPTRRIVEEKIRNASVNCKKYLSGVTLASVSGPKVSEERNKSLRSMTATGTSQSTFVRTSAPPL